MTAVSSTSVGAADQPSAATQASGSSFYAGMRILPAPQREGMYQIYSFCRVVDDIADEGGPRAERAAALDLWRSDIEALYAEGRTTARTAPLAPVVSRFGLEKDDFLAVVDGMAMDAAGDIRAPDWDTLDLYCDRVASAVGRLSVRIFGLDDEPGRALAYHLGRALQLTNILRDIDEDATIGRLYLPREALLAAGITATDPAAVARDERMDAVCAPVLARARRHFDEARIVMDAQPRRLVKAPRIMGVVYRTVLERTAAQGFAPPRTRVRTPKLSLLLAVARYGLI